MVGRRTMSAYHASFFKTLLSSDGHPFKCLQQRIGISDAESSAQAVEAASKEFEALYGCPWKLHADSIEVIADWGLKPLVEESRLRTEPRKHPKWRPRR